MKPVLGRLHVITDEQLQTRFSHIDVARRALVGGADTIQFREKRLWTTREMMDVAERIGETCAAAGALFVVDDRVDVASAIGAPAVHLGKNDLSPDIARRLLGPDILIGGTANSLDEAVAVSKTPVDYLGVGPVYGTQSKANPAPVMGLDVLRAIVRAVPQPVIAIGSISVERVDEVLATGVYGLAVLSGVTCREDPTAAAHRYRQAVDRALIARR